MLNNFIDSWVRAGAVADILGELAILLIAAFLYIRYKWQDWMVSRKKAKAGKENYDRIMRDFERSREEQKHEK